jgi:hypothetical protein
MKLFSIVTTAGAAAVLLNGCSLALAQQSPLEDTAATSTISPAQVKSKPQFHELPPLREQARLQDEWVAERKALIPKLLQKHDVDAWLVRAPFPCSSIHLYISFSSGEDVDKEAHTEAPI